MLDCLRVHIGRKSAPGLHCLLQALFWLLLRSRKSFENCGFKSLGLSVYIYIHIYIYTHMYIRIRMYICMIYLYIQICIYIYISIHIYISLSYSLKPGQGGWVDVVQAAARISFQ